MCLKRVEKEKIIWTSYQGCEKVPPNSFSPVTSTNV